MSIRLLLPVVLNLLLLASCGGGGGGGGATTPPPVNTDNRPTVSWQGLANNAVVSGTVTLTVNASDDNSVSGVEFFVDGTSIGTDQTAPYELSWDTTGLQNGDYTLMARATDTAGQTTETSVTVTVNNVVVDDPPIVNIASPANNSTVSANVTISASATDDIGVQSVTFEVDGVTLGSPDTTAPYEISWDTTSVQNGDYTLSAIATDSATQESAPSSVTVTVNNPPPVDNPPSVSITSPDGTRDLSNIEAITASATDDNGVVSVEFFVDGTSLFGDSSSPYAVSWDTTAVADGTYTILARATDTIGQTDDDTLSVDVVNAVACRDFSEDGVPDCQSPLVSFGEMIVYPGAIWGDETNTATVKVCAYAATSSNISVKAEYSNAGIGVQGGPANTALDLYDDGTGGDPIASDYQYCRDVELNVPVPSNYAFHDEVDYIYFNFKVYDENGVGIGAPDFANAFEFQITPRLNLVVTNPSASVPVNQISPNVRATSHVVNVLDAAAAGCTPNRIQQMTNQLYGLFPTTPDPFDQVAMIKSGKSFRHAHQVSYDAKDDIDHNSRDNFDSTAAYGSSGRYRGTMCMGRDYTFGALTHEYAHPFARYDDKQSRFHYFQSDDSGPLSDGGSLVPDGPGFYKQVSDDGDKNFTQFNRLTLRSMSLLCENEFGQVRIANRRLSPNERVPESETSLLTNATLETDYGPMNPSCASSQKDFRIAFVVMSDEEYANDAFMSAMHSFAVYHEGNYAGEDINYIPYVTGFQSGSLRWATGSRATFQTQLPPFD